MTTDQQREAARQFYNRWNGKGYEKGECQKFWIDLLQNVLGITDIIPKMEFEKQVYINGNTKYIDGYVPEKRVLIEQKGSNIDLDKPQSGHNGQTPYEQAFMYSNYLTADETPAWIIVSNFSEIRIYNMNETEKERKPFIIMLEEIPSKYSKIEQIFVSNKKELTTEMEISIQAGEIVGILYDELLKKYKDPENADTLRSLNMLCVRLVFCLYAEDAGIFGRKDMFHDYLANVEPKKIRLALLDLFKVLDTPADKRDPYMDEDLAAFPYVNGGLFAKEDIEIPFFDEHMKNILLAKASDGFDWSQISPTIFGAVFESTLNQETRRKGGMHYTSIENIHKVIDPLFLDDLRAELNEIKQIQVMVNRKRKLEEFQDRIAALNFLDPACGSGNFLTETYISLRSLENEVLLEKQRADRKETTGQINFDFGEQGSPIKVSIGQFYGIEINDFAVTVAKTALWIAESQMLKNTEDIIHTTIKFLPLKSYANIVEGNALRIDWNDVIPSAMCNYIMGNPPFIGARWMDKTQKDDVIHVFGKKWPGVGDLDYVCCWYKKASEYIKDLNIRSALVSTNSISQGGVVSNLWKPLFNEGIHIDFAYKTFIWDSEASLKAHVHCVIIGFSKTPNNRNKLIFSGKDIHIASNINGYLIDAKNVFIDKRTNPISDVPNISLGGQAIDDGNFILTLEEKEQLLHDEPQAAKFIRPYMMGKDFINRNPRFCIWLLGANPTDLKKCPLILRRVQKVKEFRESSERSSTLKAANTPTLFASILECTTDYVAIPKVSSERRRYIPMDYLSSDIIPGDKLFVMQNSTIYHFGILNSNVHMAWMRAVAGRLKSDYSYSNTIVYNNFPWPTPTLEQRQKIEQTAQGILDARALYPDSSLADLYDPLLMPPELQKAHTQNDIAVMRAYGFDIKTTSEADCVTYLMELYQELTENEENK